MKQVGGSKINPVECALHTIQYSRSGTLLCVVYVQVEPQVTASAEEIRDRLTQNSER